MRKSKAISKLIANKLSSLSHPGRKKGSAIFPPLFQFSQTQVISQLYNCVDNCSTNIFYPDLSQPCLEHYLNGSTLFKHFKFNISALWRKQGLTLMLQITKYFHIHFLIYSAEEGIRILIS